MWMKRDTGGIGSDIFLAIYGNVVYSVLIGNEVLPW